MGAAVRAMGNTACGGLAKHAVPKKKPVVEEEWDSRVNLDTGEIDLTEPAPRKGPRPTSDAPPRYKTIVKQRARDYSRGRLKENHGSTLETVLVPGTRPLTYKTLPRWSKVSTVPSTNTHELRQAMLAERRDRFWDACTEGETQGNTDVWMLIKWHLEKQGIKPVKGRRLEPWSPTKPQSQAWFQGCTISGVLSKGGVYKECEITGSTILHYRFQDQSGHHYEVPCFVNLEPKNML